MSIFINSAAQISTQNPLDDSFFAHPAVCTQKYCRAVEADYRQFLSPGAARRMGPLLKRAVATTVTALGKAGIANPDAIICGTGLGCIENTEKFLTSMIENGETCMQPTLFINSTHNTIASQVATFLKCNGYNSTYAHLGISFESALMDAVMMLETGRIGNALVGAHDEMTPTYFKLFEKVDYWQAPHGECSVSFVIGNERTPNSLCRLLDTDLFHSSDIGQVLQRALRFLAKNGLEPSGIGLAVTGRNGDARYDGSYDSLLAGLFPEGVAECRYKHVFGESFTAPAYGLLLGSLILFNGTVPETFLYGGEPSCGCDTILCINSFKSKDWSFILLGK